MSICKNVHFTDLCQDQCKDQSSFANKAACKLCQGIIAKPIDVSVVSRVGDIINQNGFLSQFADDLGTSVKNIPPVFIRSIIIDTLLYFVPIIVIVGVLIWKKIISMPIGIGLIVGMIVIKLILTAWMGWDLYKAGQTSLAGVDTATRTLSTNLGKNAANIMLCAFGSS